MNSNSIYSTNSLDSLLLSVKRTANTLSLLNSVTGSNKNLSYAEILKSTKKSVETKESEDKLTALEEKYQKEMEQLKMFDLFYDIYVSNGIFGNNSKARLRSAKYNAWGNIFSMQAERVSIETQIATQSAIRQQLLKVK